MGVCGWQMTTGHKVLGYFYAFLSSRILVLQPLYPSMYLVPVLHEDELCDRRIFWDFLLKNQFQKKDLNVAYMDFQFSDRLHQCLLLYLMPIPWLLLLCPPKKSPEWYRSWSSLSVKVQIANTFSFVGHGVSVPATQVCSYSMKVVRDEVKLNGCVRSNKILFPK